VEGSEAAFLGEAARGRKPSAPAAKLSGAAEASSGRQTEEAIPGRKPSAPAAKLSGAAEASSGRQTEEAIPELSLAPQAAEPVIDGALAAAAAHEAELLRAQATEPLFETAPGDRAKEAEAISAPRRLYEPRLEEEPSEESQESFLTRWFRKRVRGGAQ
jgi:hypothetical protein